MLNVTVTWGAVPGSVWDVLARRLGRQPTTAEATAEVRRIMAEATIKLAEAGRLPHQRGRR